MAYGRSYTAWRYRSRYGTRSTRRWNNGFRRRATGNSRSARQQRDAATVTISRIATVPVIISNGNNSSAVPINHWNQLRLSTYFDNYAPMYDQMKIDKIRMKVTGNQSGTAQTANLSPAVVLAFDRNGLSPNQTVNTGTISTYSSAQLKQWSTGNAFVMYQTIYPSTIMEKGQYVPTDSLLDPETTEGQVSTNPAYNLADPTLPFKPVSMLGVDLGITAASDQTFAFTVEYEYTVTFRGMRKPSLSSSSRLVPIAVNGFGTGLTPDGIIPFSTLFIQETPGQVTIGPGQALFGIFEHDNQYDVFLFNNQTSSSKYYTIGAGNYYRVVELEYNFVILTTPDNLPVLRLTEVYDDDDASSYTELYKSVFNFILPSPI